MQLCLWALWYNIVGSLFNAMLAGASVHRDNWVTKGRVLCDKISYCS